MAPGIHRLSRGLSIESRLPDVTVLVLALHCVLLLFTTAMPVIGRAVVIHKSPVPHRWVCANIEPEGAREVKTAVATFTYPVGGRIVFRQEADDPFSDTLVYVEGLVYTDGSKNRSDSHAWHVHNEIPGKDFFNWTGRCLSAGGHFNPYRISKEDG